MKRVFGRSFSAAALNWVFGWPFRCIVRRHMPDREDRAVWWAEGTKPFPVWYWSSFMHFRSSQFYMGHLVVEDRVGKMQFSMPMAMMRGLIWWNIKNRKPVFGLFGGTVNMAWDSLIDESLLPEKTRLEDLSPVEEWLKL